jgi:hypothetical protein
MESNDVIKNIQSVLTQFKEFCLEITETEIICLEINSLKFTWKIYKIFLGVICKNLNLLFTFLKIEFFIDKNRVAYILKKQLRLTSQFN